jgi:hypothetical protein
MENTETSPWSLKLGRTSLCGGSVLEKIAEESMFWHNKKER